MYVKFDTVNKIADLLAALKSQKAHLLLTTNSFILVLGIFVSRNKNATGLVSLVPSAIPPTCTDTTWLPTTVLDTVAIFCDVFLTGNSAGELYTVNATDTLRSCGMLLKTSCGRENAEFKFCDKSPDSSAFDVDSCNSCESMEYKSACLNKNATAQDLMIVLLREFCLEMHSCQSIRNIIVWYQHTLKNNSLVLLSMLSLFEPQIY